MFVNARVLDYVKEVNVTNYSGSDDNDSEIDMQTDTLNYGFTMEILPRILDHGRLIVLFSMKVVLNSKVFSFLGMNVFYIYVY